MSDFNISREEVEAAFTTCSNKIPPQIKVTDIRLVMRGLGLDPRNAEIEAMVTKIGELKKLRGEEAGADHIDVDEFMEVVRGQTDKVDKSLEEMRSAFRLFDKEGKGYIGLKDLHQVAKELGEDISLEEIEEMIGEASGSGNSKVSEQDFFAIMKKTCLY